jgi:hypothetical protein
MRIELQRLLYTFNSDFYILIVDMDDIESD